MEGAVLHGSNARTWEMEDIISAKGE